ncbi:MAG: YqgE/AlgH family protein [Puniceicoccales bacterium]|jgi:putative transcriptional regulator|nr:YqgE/AlgH family protein [Puniceicoccales bacterium]
MKKHSFSSWRSKIAGTLDGKMLIAHPLVEDEQFAKTVLFVEHDSGNTVTGVILNRPLNFMLKSLRAEFADLPISNAPVYHGGQEGETMVSLTAWVLNEEKNFFEIYYTLNDEEATELLKSKKNVQLRAFLGFCEFGKKLYDDIENGLWIVGDAGELFGVKEHSENLWRSMLLKKNPNALVYG